MTYIIIGLVIAIGIAGVIYNKNLIKKVMSLGVAQTGAIMLFVNSGKVEGGQAPILKCLDYANCQTAYVNPLPQVLMLTAIVVGLATMAVAFAIIIKLKG